MKLLLLIILIIFSGCSFLKQMYKPVPVEIQTACYYESIKYGNNDWEQERRIYHLCLINKDMKGGN